MSDVGLGDASVALVAEWLKNAKQVETRSDRRAAESLHELVDDPSGVVFTMDFADRVVRPETDRVGATQLAKLVSKRAAPQFLSWMDRKLLAVGAAVSRRLPALVMPLARRRMRGIVGSLVLDADSTFLTSHLSALSEEGFDHNVNLLGEAVLGDREVHRRMQATIELMNRPGVEYVSVKLSSVVPQLNYWDWEGCLDRSVSQIRVILDAAAAAPNGVFVNFDMEEYHDLELTMAAFCRVLGEEKYLRFTCGIVLQAYLPDSFQALGELVGWANARKQRGGGDIKVRLVKGANLSMESVEAEQRGWRLAPYSSKHEVDANYKRCLDWVLTKERTAGIRIGVASHNLFDVAWAHLLSVSRGVGGRVEFEMLQGMATAQARVVETTTGGLRLYTPVVRDEDFDVAISYLFRRLEESSSEGNFMQSLFLLEPDSASFREEARKFQKALAARWAVADGPNRVQTRPALGAMAAREDTAEHAAAFINEADTDPALSSNREWAEGLSLRSRELPKAPLLESLDQVEQALQIAGTSRWSETGLEHRQRLLHEAANELARRRGGLVAAMIHEGNKTFAEADPEFSEAIDFARFYGDRALDLMPRTGAEFTPFGTIVVASPWNFPVAIVAGGIFSALAAGNSVIVKPAPETPRCAELVVEACWAAGIPRDALQFARAPENELGRELICRADAVILTGAYETAQMFQQWKPDMRLFAETSGKNSMVVTPSADLDLAVADLVKSAFGHSGQKCSAASLAILVGDVYDSKRFRRQLVDAVESIALGVASSPATVMGPTIGPVSSQLQRGLQTLDEGESWLVEPKRQPENETELWSPGVRIGVKPDSWFYQTECFGPVLGLVKAETLIEAIAIVNRGAFGLTSGIQSLDPDEIELWTSEIEAGNLYVNKSTTGAIVQRQPFGGWKSSCVGPGAKAGGPNYVSQLGTWRSADSLDLSKAEDSDLHVWRSHFLVDHDPTGLRSESNIFRYRSRDQVAIRVEQDAPPLGHERILLAAQHATAEVVESVWEEESSAEFAARLQSLGVERVRVLGSVSASLRQAALAAGILLVDDPVTNDGYLEGRFFLREQAVSRTLHRFGNLVGQHRPAD